MWESKGGGSYEKESFRREVYKRRQKERITVISKRAGIEVKAWDGRDQKGGKDRESSQEAKEGGSKKRAAQRQISNWGWNREEDQRRKMKDKRTWKVD